VCVLKTNINSTNIYILIIYSCNIMEKDESQTVSIYNLLYKNLKYVQRNLVEIILY